MNHHIKADLAEQGFTLVELMIGLVLGLVLTSGVISLFIQSRESFMIDENVARMQDQARYAMDQLTRDIRMVSFVTEPLVPGGVILDPSLEVDNGCGPAGVDDWVFRMTDTGTGEVNTITGVDNATGAAAAAAYACISAGELRPGSDVVAVKRVAGDVVAPADLVGGTVYMQSNGTVAMLYKDPAEGAVGGPTDNWEYRPRIYYIRNFSNVAGDGIPSLCRKVLTGGDPATMTSECIAQGIESLQIEYGIDPDGDGAANQYLSNPTLTEIQDVVSARISLLARTTQPDTRYTDNRTYAVSNADDYLPNDGFHRRVYSVTVMLHNLRNLRRLGI